MQFGLYLKNKGILSADQLVAVLEVQHKHLVPLGQLAMEECVMSARDIFKVLRCQSDMPHERFGELAVELGLLSRNQLHRLLTLQMDRKPSLTDVLIRERMMTPAQVEEELAAYRREMELRNVVITRRITSRPHVTNKMSAPEPTIEDFDRLMT